MPSTIKFISYPLTSPPPPFAASVVDVFQRHEEAIGTVRANKGLTSDAVLAELREDLKVIGFAVEEGKKDLQKIERPVFFGENGRPSLNYQIDAYHRDWECGLEIEAGRAWMGNAIYRDLIQALIMVQVQYLVLAVPLQYKYKGGSRDLIHHDYRDTMEVGRALYGHDRIRMPYSLVLIGY